MRITFLSATSATAATLCMSVALLSDHPPAAQADAWQQAPTTIHLVAPPNLPDAVRRIRRDPFTSAYATATDTGNAAPNVAVGSVSSAAVLPPIPPGNPAMAGMVPNPGGGGPDVIAAAGGLVPQNGNANITVIGTVTGGSRDAVAMVQNGTDIDYVHVGDYLGQHRVTAIVAQGIEFDDGSRLAISTASSALPTQLPRHPQPAIRPATVGAPNVVPTSPFSANGVRANPLYQPLASGAVPTIAPGNTALPTVTSAPYNASETTAPDNSKVATPNPVGTPHYNLTSPIPAPTPPPAH